MSTGNACFTLAPSFSPKNYPGLVAWYNASSAILSNDSFIIGLHDLSLNANTLVASNGYSSISSDGLIYLTSNTFINTKPLEFATQSTGLTVFLVASINPNNTTINFQNLLTIFANSNNSPIQIGRYFNEENDTSTLNINTQNNILSIRENDINNENKSIINAILFNNNNNIIYTDNVVISKTSESITINTNINTFNIIIGDDGSSKKGETHSPLNNTIYEIIIYNTVLTEKTISEINKYLGLTYDISLLTDNGIFTYRK